MVSAYKFFAVIFLIIVLLAVFAANHAFSDCSTDAALVSEIYPRADQLPENLLRFYIYFSEPMSRENILSSITLRDAEGELIPGVFLDNRYDLWSPDSTRLTLLFDPGRVKTGLVAHNRLGRALISGQRYTLGIDSALDMKGCELTKAYTKTFEVREAYSTKLDLDQWQLTQPKAETREPLSINLGREMDHLSLAYRIRIENSDGNPVPGALDLADNERVWVFTPSVPWQKMDYRISVDTEMEDVSGNRLSGVFDRPPTDGELVIPSEKQYILFRP